MQLLMRLSIKIYLQYLKKQNDLPINVTKTGLDGSDDRDFDDSSVLTV